MFRFYIKIHINLKKKSKKQNNKIIKFWSNILSSNTLELQKAFVVVLLFNYEYIIPTMYSRRTARWHFSPILIWIQPNGIDRISMLAPFWARSLVSYQNNTLAIVACVARVFCVLIMLTYYAFGGGIATVCRRKEGQGQSQSQCRR